jgi:hypothetical protein
MKHEPYEHGFPLVLPNQHKDEKPEDAEYRIERKCQKRHRKISHQELKGQGQSQIYYKDDIRHSDSVQFSKIQKNSGFHHKYIYFTYK